MEVFAGVQDVNRCDWAVLLGPLCSSAETVTMFIRERMKSVEGRDSSKYNVIKTESPQLRRRCPNK